MTSLYDAFGSLINKSSLNTTNYNNCNEDICMCYPRLSYDLIKLSVIDNYNCSNYYKQYKDYFKCNKCEKQLDYHSALSQGKFDHLINRTKYSNQRMNINNSGVIF